MKSFIDYNWDLARWSQVPSLLVYKSRWAAVKMRLVQYSSVVKLQVACLQAAVETSLMVLDMHKWVALPSLASRRSKALPQVRMNIINISLNPRLVCQSSIPCTPVTILTEVICNCECLGFSSRYLKRAFVMVPGW